MQGSYLCNGNYIKGETAGYAVKNSVLNLIFHKEDKSVPGCKAPINQHYSLQ